MSELLAYIGAAAAWGGVAAMVTSDLWLTVLVVNAVFVSCIAVQAAVDSSERAQEV